MLLNVRSGLGQAHVRDELPGILQGLGLEIQNHVPIRRVRVGHDVVKHYCLDLEIGEVAQVAAALAGLLGLKVPEDVHPGLLHDGE